jgi:hypothetical protein
MVRPVGDPALTMGITPPNTLKFPVLGRIGFLDQVDVTFAEFEKVLYLRFGNPALRRMFE